MKNPPTLQMCEDYIRKNNLLVDPAFFHKFFTEGEWIDTRGNKVKSWKLKMLTWHRMALERGGSRPCNYSSCKKPGIYISGKDRDGHPYYYCIDHKPNYKQVLPSTLTQNALKKIDSVSVNKNNERNRQIEALAKEAKK